MDLTMEMIYLKKTKPLYFLWNKCTRVLSSKKMSHCRLELQTAALKGRCSTTWANGPSLCKQSNNIIHIWSLLVKPLICFFSNFFIYKIVDFSRNRYKIVRKAFEVFWVFLWLCCWRWQRYIILTIVHLSSSCLYLWRCFTVVWQVDGQAGCLFFLR